MNDKRFGAAIEHEKGCKQRDAFADKANQTPLLMPCTCDDIRADRAEKLKAFRRPRLFSNHNTGVSNYGQRAKSGAFVRNDIADCPGTSRREKKANLRAAEKQRIQTLKFLSQQKEKNVEPSAKPSK